MMIDWVTAKIPLAHEQPLHGGKVQCTDAYGQIEYVVNRRLSVQGSHSSTISIRTLHTGPEGEIEFSGNPVKFLKGHNLYGSTNIVELMKHTLEKVFRQLNIKPTPENWHAIRTGQYTLTRVDLNEMISMGSLADVLAWIRATSHASRSRHKSGGILRGDTLYFGKESRRWAMKLYAKGQEINAKGHELPANLSCHALLTKWAQNKLRWELVLRGPELRKNNINSAAALNACNTKALFCGYKNRLTIPEKHSLDVRILDQLPRHLRRTHWFWACGDDLRNRLSKNTYYSHRRELLKYGLDIAVAPLPA